MANRRGKKEREREAKREKGHAEDRSRRLRTLAVLTTVVVVVLVLAAFALTRASGPNGGPGIGVRAGLVAPDFTITDIDGRSFQLYEHRGHPVVIDFMGSFCSACVVQMRSLVPVYGDLAPRGLIVLSIDVGGTLGTENPEDARTFMATHGGTWPIALDNQGLGSTFQVTTPSYVLPKTFIIAPNGVIVTADTGILSESTLRSTIEPLL